MLDMRYRRSYFGRKKGRAQVCGSSQPEAKELKKLEKIFLCGDPHGEFDHILKAIDEFHPNAIIILGDLTPDRSLDEIFKDIGETKVFWIPGNHDTDSDLIYDRIWRSKFATNNLHGKVLDVCGVKVAGLGGVFRGQIWMPPASPCYSSPGVFIKKLGKATTWRGGLPRRHRSTIFSSVYDKLKECKADVLVTHEAPSIHAKGFECLDILADQLGVKYFFHAHQHESKNYGVINGFVARGIGLRGIIALAGNVIVPAEADLRETANKFQYEKKPKVKKLPASKFRRLYKARRDRQFKGQSSWKSIDKHPGMELRGGFRQAGQDHGPREDKSSN